MSKLYIKADVSGNNSAVYLDDKEIPGVAAIDIMIFPNELVRATLEVHVDHVEAFVDEEIAEVKVISVQDLVNAIGDK